MFLEVAETVLPLLVAVAAAVAVAPLGQYRASRVTYLSSLAQ
jgi:hypothetical protein